LSKDDSRRLLEIIYPDEPDPAAHARAQLKRRHRRHTWGALLLLLVLAAAAAPHLWRLVAGALNP